MISKEELAKFIEDRIDAEVIGDYDLYVIRQGAELTVWAEHQTDEDDKEEFEVDVNL